LNDRHTRRQDREYREDAERRRLALENLSRENQVLAERIRIAKEIGATERDLTRLLDNFVFKPLLSLDHHQDSGVIGATELSPMDDEEDEPPPKRPRR
jgi:DNA-directed RNA polymerase specialized sigma subunit